MKHKTMSKYSRWTTCLFFIRSSISSLSFKIFCWFFFICKLKGLYLIIFFFDGLLMVFLDFVCELLPNLWEYHITAVSSEVCCLWLLTWKYYLIHALIIDVIVIFSRILGQIHEVIRRGGLVQLPLMSVIFITQKGYRNDVWLLPFTHLIRYLSILRNIH